MYELTTQYDEGLGTYNIHSSALFTTRALKDITITTFDLNIDGSPQTNCLIYTIPGIFDDILNIDEWDLLSNTTLYPNGIGYSTSIPYEEFTPLELLAAAAPYGG